MVFTTRRSCFWLIGPPRILRLRMCLKKKKKRIVAPMRRVLEEQDQSGNHVRRKVLRNTIKDGYKFGKTLEQ